MKPTRQLLESMAKAGIKLPEGVAPRVGPGELVVAFEVPFRPIPWKAPSTTRTGHAYKDKRLVEWQEAARGLAAIAMGGAPPYAGPVRLALTFDLTRKAGSPPDLSNLVKALEDSLQGVVIANDRQVVAITSTRRIGDRDGAGVSVYAFGGES